MLLRDFWVLDWENKYYVIHAGDDIRLRRAETDEMRHLMDQWYDYWYKRRTGAAVVEYHPGMEWRPSTLPPPSVSS